MMSTDTATAAGRISRVSGPLVEARGLEDVEMHEMIEVGPDGLVGEIIKLDGPIATIQVYEHTGGLQPGQTVSPTGHPLSLTLGPGLLGSIFDGIQRPLVTLEEQSGAFIRAGEKARPLDPDAEWHFEPRAEEGDQLEGGEAYGAVRETQAINHLLMVPPRSGGAVRSIQPEGDYAVDDTICVLEGQDGKTELTMAHVWPTRTPRPIEKRVLAEQPLVTGQRVIDVLFPIAEGGASAIPGDFGTGKTMMQHSLAKWAHADIVVYVGCGERGNEMTDILREFPDLEDPRTNRSLMERTILIANTSNMPVAAREISIYTGITVAEYYRDMGYRVALMADSTSRWAEALREVSSQMEEMPAEEGFPAYLPTRLAQFYERAGKAETLSGATGSITVIGAVSPPEGDFSEPVTQHTKRFTRCFWALDSDLAHARHYPAISWLDSYSEYIREIRGWWEEHDREWWDLREEAMSMLQEEQRLQEIVDLVGPDVLPDNQRLILLAADLMKSGFLQQNALHPVDTYCEPEKQLMLFRTLMTFYRRAETIIEQGAPVARIRELDVLDEMRRAKERIENGDTEALRDLLSRVNRQLDEVEKEYTE